MSQTDDTVAPLLSEPDEARQRAIAEILAELKEEPPEAGGERPEAGGERPEAGGERPEAGGERPEAGGERPEAGDQSPDPSTLDPRPSTLVPPASGLRPPPPAPRSSCLAITPRTIVLLNALFVVAAIAGIWFIYERVTAALGELARRPAAAPVAAAPRPAAALAPAPAPAEPVLQVDEGLRYVQEMEKADLLFEKGDHHAAAAAYRRALDVMPPGWNDGAAAFRLGECYFRLADYPQAIAAYERVALAGPGEFQPRALFQSGEAHLRLGSYVRARQAFYSLLLRQARCGPELASCIERAYYRLADTYWLEAEQIAASRKGSGK